MKILCLHGYGTNAAVMGNQMQVFLSIADKEIEPFYLEGEIEAPKAASKFLPPNFGNTKLNTQPQVLVPSPKEPFTATTTPSTRPTSRKPTKCSLKSSKTKAPSTGS